MAKTGASPPALGEYRRKRDFSETLEPSGGGGSTKRKRRGALHFVIQKHAASHLHFDLRLELDGVMKSWAVPKGPSLDPSVKRLAMQVEDHPIEYNAFEGTIPKGQYGGGTVMLWDRGTYTAEGDPTDPGETIRRGYERGDLKILLHGERLRGSWVLVRTRRGEEAKPQWLLIKHRDEYALLGSDIVTDAMTSVTTGRTMDEIAAGDGGGHVWNSNREPSARGAVGKSAGSKRATRPTAVEPMLASIGKEVPEGDGWTFEPKYDGIRVLAFATPTSARLITRNQNDKSAQFPEIVQAITKLAARSRKALVLDGEIVAIAPDGENVARFQELQARMHVKEPDAIAGHATSTPAALIVFDLLVDGDATLVHEPWSNRRTRLERALRNRTSPHLRLGESVPNDGEVMLERALGQRWEGVIAKRMDAPYEPGVRSRAWRKLKLEHRQEFVVGGYTEPRNTREHIGALLLGYFDDDRFIYVGHTGGGFTRAGLAEMHALFGPLERKTSPFEETPKTNERAHWVEPSVVVEVKFNEWTADGRLRQPIYLGTRDDKDARLVRREPESVQPPAAPTPARAPTGTEQSETIMPRSKSSQHTRKTASEPARRESGHSAGADIVAQLDQMERGASEGTLTIRRGVTFDVTSLGKVFFPDDGITKGDLLRYYARMAGAVLPVMKDRPLVLKRFPNGITGQSFYQQNAADEVPKGIRVEVLKNDEGEEQRRIIGGDLATLLWTIQLGAISVDPWHSRIQTCDDADYTVLDLDPGPRASFERVIQVALWVREALAELGLQGAAKTSGSRGLHIYVPLQRKTPDEAALLAAQIVATRVAELHPREATVERFVKARPPSAVYVDYLQNIRGKTVAAAYSVRAKPGATVSTPLEWEELTPSLSAKRFTIETVPERVAEKGDLWAKQMAMRNSLRAFR